MDEQSARRRISQLLAKTELLSGRSVYARRIENGEQIAGFLLKAGEPGIQAITALRTLAGIYPNILSLTDDRARHLAEALAGLVDRDLCYDGPNIVIRCADPLAAIRQVRAARSTLDRERAGKP